MEFLQPIILGIVQGLTEFLPISSSGHLVLVPALLGWEIQNVTFDVGLHAGTSLAVLLYFYKDWGRMIISFFSDISTWSKSPKISILSILRRDSRVLLYILVATVPVGIVGILFEKTAENFFRAPLSIAIMLISVSVVMLLADFKGMNNSSNESKLSFKNIIFIALSQILALIPGTSRSGITISTGMFLGMSREQSASISFLLATPIILAATIFKLPEILNGNSMDLLNMLIGFVVSFTSGMICIGWLMKYLRKNSLKWFIIYRVILGFFIIWFFHFK